MVLPVVTECKSPRGWPAALLCAPEGQTQGVCNQSILIYIIKQFDFASHGLSPYPPFYSKCCRAALSRSCSSCQCSCRQDGVSTYRAGRERKRLRRHQPAPAKIAATMNSTHASDMPLPSGEFLTIIKTGHLED